MATRIPLILLLSTACLNGRPQSPPWYAEVISTDIVTVAARYDDEGTLHAVGVGVGDTIHHGTFDDRERALVWGDPLTFDVEGTPYDPATVGVITFDRLDLAIPPGEDMPWLWLDGFAGPVVEGSDTIEVVAAHPPPGGARPVAGGLVFEDADTLIMAQNNSGVVAAVARKPVSDALTSDGEMVMMSGAPMPTFCAADVAAGLMHLRPCNETNRRVVDLATEELAEQASEDDDDILYLRSAMTGVSDDWILGQGLDTATCVGPSTDDGRAVISTRKFKYEGNCYGVHATLTSFMGGDIRGDGGQFTVFYGNSLFLVFDRNTPRNRERDVAGAWCNGVDRFELADDGTFIPPSRYSDSALFADLSWRGNGETLRIDYKDRTAANFAWDGDVHVEHWARRVGDTLHMKTYTHEKYETDGAGLSAFGGLWVPCP